MDFHCIGIIMAAIGLALGACIPTAFGAAADWQQLFEERFDNTAINTNWQAVSGHWIITEDGISKLGRKQSGVLLLRLPVVSGAIRVEYEAKSDDPGDLSLILGTKAGDLDGAVFWQFGCNGNRDSRLTLPGRDSHITKSKLIERGRWHKIVATREAGRLTYTVDGQTLFEEPDTAAGYAGPYLALSIWHQGTIRGIRIFGRDDPKLAAFLDPPAATREDQTRAMLATQMAQAQTQPAQPLIYSKLFVSPRGNDRWSGQLPEPSPDGQDGPLATLDAARDRIRPLRQNPRFAGATVQLRGGLYPRTTPLLLTPEDGGTTIHLQPPAAKNPSKDPAPVLDLETYVTYAAYPGETPIIDGGTRLTNWRTETLQNRTFWVADLPEVAAGRWYFQQLFVDGQRRPRPRLPKEGNFWIENVPGLKLPAPRNPTQPQPFTCHQGDVQAWKNLTDVEVVVLHFWHEERSPIASFDPATRLVTLARTPLASLVDSYQSRYAHYYVDNVFEALTQPGEWYLDRPAGRLYYLPREGEKIETAAIIAPRALQLLEVRGNAEKNQFVEHLRLQGLSFAHTDWRHPESRGHSAAAGQAAYDVPGVVRFEAARHSSFEDCQIAHVGWYGLELANGCRDIRLLGNDLFDLGAGGIKLNGSDLAGPPALRTGENTISDNHIHSAGRVFHSAVGVLAMHSFGNIITHNHIHDLYYTGISVGWSWGYADTVSRNNLIASNHIHDIGQGWLSDLAGIYTLGVQPGTVIRNNLIHDITKDNYGGWAIYLDEGSSHIIVENNICYRTNDHVFHQHYGRENTLRNNIFAFGDAGILRYALDEPHLGFTFERNILVMRNAPAFVWRSTSHQRRITSDLNLFWDVNSTPLLEGFDSTPSLHTDMAAWRNAGFDQHSMIADPLFRDLKQFDFTLKPESPAFQLGFKPIDISDVGVRPRSQRGL